MREEFILLIEHEITQEQARQIFEEYSTYVYRIALMLTKSKTMADDITQETFLRVFQKFHMYDVSKPIRPWLYQITLNITRNMLRKQKWLRFLGQIPDTEKTNSTEDIFLKSEREQEIWEAVNRLSDKGKEVIVLHYYAGLQLDEIASILEIPLGTCKSRLHAALNTLRKSKVKNYIVNSY